MIAAVVSSVLWYQTPLRQDRPSRSLQYEDNVAREESIVARLWEDPFMAVKRRNDMSSAKFWEQVKKEQTAKSKSESELRISLLFSNESQFKDHFRNQKVLESAHRASRITLMTVIVEGGDYAESVERRLRTRTAVVTALGAAGYVPQDPEHIGSFLVKNWSGRFSKVKASSDNSDYDPRDEMARRGDMEVPFEWFEQDHLRINYVDQGDHDHDVDEVLVLWLREDNFVNHQLWRMAKFMRVLTQATKPGVKEKSQKQNGETNPDAADKNDKHNDENSTHSTGHSHGHDDVKNEVAAGEIKELNDDGWHGLLMQRTRIIGPASSGMLGAMVRDAAPLLYWDDRTDELSEEELEKIERLKWIERQLRGVSMLSPWSTVAEELLIHNWDPTHHEDVSLNLRERLAKVGLDFKRAVCSDELLVQRLVEELRLRGVDLTDIDGKDHVVLISEWDRFYGRAISTTFAAVVKYTQLEAAGKLANEYPNLQAFLKDVEQWSEPVSQIHLYSHSRGLDGASISPESQEPDPRDQRRSRGSESDKLEDWVKGLEYPRGPSQLDYLRRLAGRIKELDRQLKRDGEGKIRAIGLMGSDVYDKLLALQALKQTYPGVIYFTTDLDARLIHPKNYKWTRNMIIASSFDLRLSDNLQQSKSKLLHKDTAPPFRETYQTSVFYACLGALGKIPENSIEGNMAPRLFEVSRSGSFDISFEEDRSYIHPTRAEKYGTPMLLTLTFFVLLFGFLLLVASNPMLRNLTIDRIGYALGVQESGKKQIALEDSRKIAVENRVQDMEEKYFRRIVFLSILGIIVLVFILARSVMNAKGESFFFFEGISIWPTELLRLFIIVYCFSYFCIASIRIRRSNITLTFKYGLTQTLARTEGKKLTPDEEIECLLGSGRETFLQLWNRLRTEDRLKASAVRVGEETFVQSLFISIRALWRARTSISISQWRKELLEPPYRDSERKANEIWNEYMIRSSAWNRFTRALPMVIVYFVFSFLLMELLGTPNVPFRGQASVIVDTILDKASVVLMITSTLLVVDATRLCERFILLLADGPTVWPDPEKASGGALTEHVDYPDWHDIKLIAERTKVIGRLIVYPFIIIFLMLISRNSYFDNWDWPISLLIVMSLIAAHAILCALTLRKAAETARLRAIDRLRLKLLKEYAKGDKKIDGPRALQIKHIIEDIENITEGAFAPLSNHPVLAALALPFGGMGTLILLEMFATA